MDNKILYANKGGMYFYKLEGNITHLISAGFDESINRIFKNLDIDSVLVDLSTAVYLDSTNLGLLAKIARNLYELNLNQATLISPNEEIIVVLESMGLLNYFTVVNDNNNGEQEYNEIAEKEIDLNSKCKLLLDTHRELMNVNEKNHNIFKNVVSTLESEFKNLD